MINFIPLSGLCNRMRALDSAVSLCRETGSPLRVYWVKAVNMDCSFSDLFKPIPDLELIEKNRPFVFSDTQVHLYSPHLYRHLSDWVILNNQNIKEMLERRFDFRILQSCRQVLMSSNVRFYPAAKMYSTFLPIECLRQRIDMESASFHQNTIGIHIRRTDHTLSIDNSPTELFKLSIDKEIALNSNVNFYLASDCVSTKQQLQGIYGDRIITNFDKSDRTSREGMQQALVELYTLSRTRKIYGSFRSSFSTTAAEINGIVIITVKN